CSAKCPSKLQNWSPNSATLNHFRQLVCERHNNTTVSVFKPDLYRFISADNMQLSAKSTHFIQYTAEYGDMAGPGGGRLGIKL
ncbi:MAG: hypothetical protein MI864_22285, partial [Pseudomonadales bacterium]|nr:hypothetical protein [Pseudomonadales bacterium]